MDDDVVTIPRCAVHEEAHSTQPCARCGNYACPLCLDPASVFPEYCAACRAREGAQRIAWERSDAGVWRRFGRTLRDVLLRPALTFDRAEPGSLPRALSYAALVGALMGLVQGIVIAFGMILGIAFLRPASITLAILLVSAVFVLVVMPIFVALQAVATSIVHGLVYHLGVRSVGGRGALSTSVWATSYLYAIWIVWLPIVVLQAMPLLSALCMLAVVLFVAVWTSIRLTQIGQRHHGLSARRAAIAAWFPALVGFAVLIAITVAIVMIDFTAIR